MMDWMPWIVWLLVILIACYIFVVQLRNYGVKEDEAQKDSIEDMEE